MKTGKFSDNLRVTENRLVSGVDRVFKSSNSTFRNICDRLNPRGGGGGQWTLNLPDTWFRLPPPHFGTCLCSNFLDQIPRICNVFTRLFTTNTPWDFLYFAYEIFYENRSFFVFNIFYELEFVCQNISLLYPPPKIECIKTLESIPSRWTALTAPNGKRKKCIRCLGMSMAWEPDGMSNFFSSPHVHLCAINIWLTCRRLRRCKQPFYSLGHSLTHIKWPVQPN